MNQSMYKVILPGSQVQGLHHYTSRIMGNRDALSWIGLIGTLDLHYLDVGTYMYFVSQERSELHLPTAGLAPCDHSSAHVCYGSRHVPVSAYVLHSAIQGQILALQQTSS